MLDGYFKTRIDRIWDGVAGIPVRLGMTPNQVTWSGLLLMAVVCLLHLAWPEPAVFAVAIAAVFAFDSLDGAVARRTGLSSAYGGYLDAMVDRYQEAMVLAALAWTHDCWPEAFLALSGSFLVSYAKARTAIERPIDNQRWPDLMERLERVIFLCGGLLVASVLSWPPFIPLMVAALGVLTHGTVVQRFLRARRLLRAPSGHSP